MGSDLSSWCTCTGGGDWHEPYCEIFKAVKRQERTAEDDANRARVESRVAEIELEVARMKSGMPIHGSRAAAFIRNGHGQAPTPDGFVHMNDTGNNWHTWTARCDQGVCLPASDLRPVPAHPDSVPTDPNLYCWACDHDTHRCHGCGEPLPHGSYACKECSNL